MSPESPKGKRGRARQPAEAEPASGPSATPAESKPESGGESPEARKKPPSVVVDRVHQFADSLTEQAEKEEERHQELETWVSCHIEEGLFGLPVERVQEVLRVSTLTRVPHAPFPVRGVTNMRGHVLPVVDLRVRLGREPVEIDEDHRIIVVASRNRLIGLLVDAVDQVLQIDRLVVEEPPEEVMTANSYYISGVYQLDEELLVLLDTDRVLAVREDTRVEFIEEDEV